MYARVRQCGSSWMGGGGKLTAYCRTTVYMYIGCRGIYYPAETRLGSLLFRNVFGRNVRDIRLDRRVTYRLSLGLVYEHIRTYRQSRS